ncbi:MAG: hypothetical protein AABZ54_01630 [Bacteroidota bacterium]
MPIVKVCYLKHSYLILTPINESELQLKILAEVSRKFSNVNSADKVTESKSPEEVISKLKQLS